MSGGYCEQTGKVKYASAQEARSIIETIKRTPHKRARESRSTERLITFRCSLCGWHHIGNVNKRKHRNGFGCR